MAKERFNKLSRYETDIVLTTDVGGKSWTLVVDESTGYCSFGSPNFDPETGKNDDVKAAANHKDILGKVAAGTLAADEPGDHEDDMA